MEYVSQKCDHHIFVFFSFMKVSPKYWKWRLVSWWRQQKVGWRFETVEVQVTSRVFFVSSGRRVRASVVMSTTSQGCVTARPVRWPTASTPPSERRKVTTWRLHRFQKWSSTDGVNQAVTDGCVCSCRSVFPLHESDRESSFSCQDVGEGEHDACFLIRVD